MTTRGSWIILQEVQTLRQLFLDGHRRPGWYGPQLVGAAYSGFFLDRLEFSQVPNQLFEGDLIGFFVVLQLVLPQGNC